MKQEVNTRTSIQNFGFVPEKAVKRGLLLLSLLLMSQAAFAGQVLITALKDLSPVADGVLKIDEERVFLSETGTAAIDLQAGVYTASLQQYGQALAAFSFELTESEHHADISILLETGIEPQIEVKRYAETDSAVSAEGIVTGFITSKENGEPVTGAVIRDASGELNTTSAEDGSFELGLQRGVYDLTVAAPGFASATVSDFTVLADSFVELNYSLVEEGKENLEEVVAIGSFIADTVTADERDSSAILDVIGSEQLARFGDSSAASALKRVAGVSINDGKYAVVRGLNERYTAVTLNGSSLPSPDPTRRVVPLDIFPSSILSQINVAKSNSADLPSDSTGGVIQLNTANLSGEKKQKLSVSLAHTSHVTYSSLNTYDGGGKDFLGMDDGTRSIPGAVKKYRKDLEKNLIDDEERQEVGRAFKNNYAVTRDKAHPDLSIEYSIEDTLSVEDTDNQWGYLAGIKYKNQWSREDSERATYSSAGGNLIKDDNYNYDRASNEIDLSAVFSARYDISTQHSFISNTMLLRQSQADATTRRGIIGDNDRDVIARYISWEEKQFLIQQFLGEHRFYNQQDLKANWRVSASQAELDSPDSRSYSYETADTDPHRLYDSSISREFLTLNDDNIDFGFSLDGIVATAPAWELRAKGGFDYFDRERESGVERFGFNDTTNSVITDLNLESVLAPVHINPNEFELLYQTLPSDKYTGIWEYDAVYGKLNFEYFDFYKVELGARSENSYQQLDSVDFSGFNKTTTLDDSGILPSANLTWFTAENFQTRLGFSQTKNRPDFREISNAVFYHPETRDRFTGNDKLIIAEVDNFDARGEWYLSDRESISLAFFNKEFINPIEVIAQPGGGDSVVYSYENQDTATVNGLELDFKKEHDFAAGLAFISGNLSLIDSEVTLLAPDLAGNTEREMQGQPENIVNFQIGFDHYKTGWEYTLVMNRKGESLFAVGVQDLPNIMEEARLQFDTNIKNQIRENLSIKASIDNVTDSTVEYTQGGKPVRTFKKGRTLTGSVTYTF